MMNVKNFFGEDIDEDNVRFFFIFGPNNSGTTILSQYISVQTNRYLPEYGNNEGQMIPSVKKIMRNRPWNPKSKFPWDFIRSKWEEKSKGKVFIESSPPNILRYEDIKNVFGEDSSALSIISTPYHQISSCLRRYNSPPFSAKKLVRQWIKKARYVKEFRENYPHFPKITYNEFVSNPLIINNILDINVRPFFLNGKKKSNASGIEDQTALAYLFLKEHEIDRINEELVRHMEIINFFELNILSGKEVYDIYGTNEKAKNLAQERRDKWDLT